MGLVKWFKNKFSKKNTADINDPVLRELVSQCLLTGEAIIAYADPEGNIIIQSILQFNEEYEFVEEVSDEAKQGFH